MWRVTDDGEKQMRTPKLIVISAPSGCGKTTIAREILKRYPDIAFSVSATTRPKRSNEVDGVDYFFLTNDQFHKNIDDGAMVEWEEIYGNYYGTLKPEIDRALHTGQSMLFDVDVNGALSIKKKYPKDTILIFIKPPSMEVLTQRLRNRKTETPETIQQRLDRVPMELQQAKQFDVSVINDELQDAIQRVDDIIRRAIGVAV